MKKIFYAITAPLVASFVVFFSWAQLFTAVDEHPREYKNVILMIGDGMGENTLAAAKAATGKPLVMETFSVRAQSKTNAWPGFILTDSAAGGTALSCGIRTGIGYVAVSPWDPLQVFGTPSTIAEQALANGKAAGVVTTDKTSGATPASFCSHAESRDNEAKISLGELTSGMDLIWGAASKSITKENAAANGFSYVNNKTDWQALSSKERSFAQFSLDDLANTQHPEVTPTLKEMTEKAIDRLDDNENGFFLMVEGAHIDKYSHANDLANCVRYVYVFDEAIAAAKAYADARDDTLILITADHETGGITQKNGQYVYTTDGHSMANVPVFCNKTDAGFQSGFAYKNRRIGAQLGRVLGIDSKKFPG
ncbi:MAG: alkaline phosphatase [Oscillospiraceae bacterium]|jgi:alkaline phosphatase|nr:alkaline phosphatase [Oscillospiraceae bacterium]